MRVTQQCLALTIALSTTDVNSFSTPSQPFGTRRVAKKLSPLRASYFSYIDDSDDMPLLGKTDFAASFNRNLDSFSSKYPTLSRVSKQKITTKEQLDVSSSTVTASANKEQINNKVTKQMMEAPGSKATDKLEPNASEMPPSKSMGQDTVLNMGKDTVENTVGSTPSTVTTEMSGDKLQMSENGAKLFAQSENTPTASPIDGVLKGAVESSDDIANKSLERSVSEMAASKPFEQDAIINVRNDAIDSALNEKATINVVTSKMPEKMLHASEDIKEVVTSSGVITNKNFPIDEVVNPLMEASDTVATDSSENSVLKMAASKTPIEQDAVTNVGSSALDNDVARDATENTVTVEIPGKILDTSESIKEIVATPNLATWSDPQVDMVVKPFMEASETASTGSLESPVSEISASKTLEQEAVVKVGNDALNTVGSGSDTAKSVVDENLDKTSRASENMADFGLAPGASTSKNLEISDTHVQFKESSNAIATKPLEPSVEDMAADKSVEQETLVKIQNVGLDTAVDKRDPAEEISAMLQPTENIDQVVETSNSVITADAATDTSVLSSSIDAEIVIEGGNTLSTTESMGALSDVVANKVSVNSYAIDNVKHIGVTPDRTPAESASLDAFSMSTTINHDAASGAVSSFDNVEEKIAEALRTNDDIVHFDTAHNNVVGPSISMHEVALSDSIGSSVSDTTAAANVASGVVEGDVLGMQASVASETPADMIASIHAVAMSDSVDHDMIGSSFHQAGTMGIASLSSVWGVIESSGDHLAGPFSHTVSSLIANL